MRFGHAVRTAFVAAAAAMILAATPPKSVALGAHSQFARKEVLAEEPEKERALDYAKRLQLAGIMVVLGLGALGAGGFALKRRLQKSAERQNDELIRTIGETGIGSV